MRVEHPLARAGFGTPSLLRFALEAADSAIGELADRIAWSRLPPGGGMVPTAVYLDDSDLSRN
jgi:hypothetical protein